MKLPKIITAEQYRKAMGVRVAPAAWAHERHQPGRREGMNKTEQRYASRLELLQRAGEIDFWQFEPFNLRLADKTFFQIDFVVFAAGKPMTCIDVKGSKGDKPFVEEDAQIKIKVAAQQFWIFRFIQTWEKGNQWLEREF